MSSNAARAYLLHARKYRDSAILIELLCSERGRVAAVARGVGPSRAGALKRALLQPFQPLIVQLTGRSELRSLRSVESSGPAFALSGEALLCALYINELLVRVLAREDPCDDIFVAYQLALQSLSAAPATELDLTLRHFEWALLIHAGYALDIEIDGDSGEAVLPDRWYRFDPDVGLVRVHGEQPDHGFSGQDLIAIANADFTLSSRRTFKRLTRTALAPMVGARPLMSRSLFGEKR